ncbi:unnamed protein product [Penicillium salamii]|uniref:DUF7702 domain-containing protein n=1 Tax=Penicillium salamii TaxID=1612424 RepID=A0A9W4JHN5_9EURO|nr:unnamed protein product [Penicillium salamii]CAG8147345.1 unnamed protein product [Penicillium salamii]CAG8378228.1 unnamed protein product [Penicillium salamii]CAG8379676.1 unnamed protein product [Penicillium salamii]CAG8382507.1 unnamed protein product [Penicillium salamii]
MELNLLSRSLDSSVSPGKRNIAIAEIVIYSLIHITQFSTRFLQERHYWHHTKNKGIGRCIFYSWFSMVGLLSQIRIAGSALVLASSHPDQSLVTAASVMQSVGLSPLLFEVSLVMLRCGQSGETGPGNSKWTKWIRFALHFFRFPIFFAIILAVVGGIIQMHELGEAGSILLIVTFVYVCSLVTWLAVKARSVLPKSGQQAALLVVVTLPFLLVRVIYFLLLEYGPPQFNPASGDVGIMIGMGLLMEILVVVLLILARAVAEPILPSVIKTRIAYDDLESPAD